MNFSFRICALAVAVASGSLSTSAFGQTSSDIEKITVTTNGFELPVKQALASVVVIDRQAIDQSPAQDVATLLAGVAGIQTARSGGFGQTVGLFVRGSNTNQTLILIDGVRVGSATLGYKSLATLSLNQIERIEIVKGPRAAWYGSDAVAGVIQIFTRRSQGNGSVELTGGSNKYKKAVVNAGYKDDQAYINATFSHEKTDGFNARESGSADRDGYKNNNVAITAGYNDDDLGEFTFSGALSDGYAQYDVSSENDVTDFRHHHAKIGWKKQYANVSHSLSYAIAKDKEVSVSFGNSRFAYITDKQQAEYQALYEWSPALTLTGGANWSEDDISDSESTNVTFTNYKQDNFAVYMGAYYSKDWLSANLTVRNDDQSQFGNETTYMAAFGIDVIEHGKLRFSHGTAFRAPTFNDLYSPYGGNPNIRPETSDQQEIAFDYSLENIELSLALFRQDVEDLIVWTPDDEAGYEWSPKNLDNAEIMGAEFSIDYTLWGTEQSFSATWLDTEDKATGNPLPQRAEQSAVWRMSKQFEYIRTQVEFEYRGKRQSGIGNNELPSYALWRMIAEYTPTDDWTVFAKITNALDKRYQAVPGYFSPEREVYLGVRYEF